MTTEKRRILGPLEKIILIAAVLIISYVIYKNDDINLLERSESIQIIDKPHAGKQATRKRDYQPEQTDAKVEAALQQLAQQFSGDSGTANSWQQMGLSEDEGQYYEGVKERNSWDSSINKAADWLALLKASHRTYSQLQSLFSDFTGKTKEEVEADDVEMLMKNETSAELIYERIEQVFHIPKTEIQSFADKGRRALSDWAEFIEENQSKKQ